jgi:hypothetical protein
MFGICLCMDARKYNFQHAMILSYSQCTTCRGIAIFFFFFFFFFFIYVGCPGQLTRTTTIPHGPLNILQAQEQVRHRGGDRRAHRGSNPGRERNKSHGWPQQLDPQVRIFLVVHDLMRLVPLYHTSCLINKIPFRSSLSTWIAWVTLKKNCLGYKKAF